MNRVPPTDLGHATEFIKFVWDKYTKMSDSYTWTKQDEILFVDEMSSCFQLALKVIIPKCEQIKNFVTEKQLFDKLMLHVDYYQRMLPKKHQIQTRIASDQADANYKLVKVFESLGMHDRATDAAEAFKQSLPAVPTYRQPARGGSGVVVEKKKKTSTTSRKKKIIAQ